MSKKLNIFLIGLVAVLSAYRFLYKKEGTSLSFTADHQLRHQKIIARIPDDLTFANEKIHFKTSDAYQKYYKALKVNTASNSSTRLLLRNVSLYLPIIEKILVQNDIPKDFKYLAVAESNLSHEQTSGKGAAGIWQFTSLTAQDYGLEINEEVDERYHLVRSTMAAAKYFKSAHKLFGSWTAAAASYNRGIGGLQKAFRNQSVNSYYDLALNRETASYIYKILALKDLINSPKKYNLVHSRSRLPEMKLIKVDTTIHNLEEFSRHLNIDYPTFRAYNPWLLGNTLTIKTPGSFYYISIPKNAPPPKPEVADTVRTTIPKGYTRNKNFIIPKIDKSYRT